MAHNPYMQKRQTTNEKGDSLPDKSECKHSTKLTGQCVKCGEYPYEGQNEKVSAHQTNPRKIDVRFGNIGAFGSTMSRPKSQQPKVSARYIKGDGTNMQLYVRSMGKLLAVTALFDTDDKANAYMESHRDEGVVATGNGLVLLANLYDHGTRVELPVSSDRTRLYMQKAR